MHEFNKRHSPNTLSVRVLHTADWWLGDPQSPPFRAAADAVEDVWGEKPAYVREGGTMVSAFCGLHICSSLSCGFPK